MQSRLSSNTPDPVPPSDEIISYKKLRAFIGITGMILPVVVVLGSYVFGAGQYSFQRSVSHYYYSLMHIVFVGILCILGAFLITYKGKSIWESRMSNLAGYCAFGIAAFPTSFTGFFPEEGGRNQYLILITSVTTFWGHIHYAFAGVLFVCFAIFCLYFFQKPDEEYPETEMKKFRRRKVIYKICGITIIVSLLSIACISIFDLAKGVFVYATFIFETTSLWAFGIAWLVKGSSAFKETPVVKKLVNGLR